ncbi:MAG: phage tail protein [Eubacterium sp.]|jgi:Phage tail sheath protein.|nr:phage tail protein [Eubacterium sp.]
MALGGGKWTAQNKVLPGTYVNFVSAASASDSISDRGVVTMPLSLDWGPEDRVFEVTNEDFTKRTLQIFGCPYGAPEMKGLRDLFKNAQTLYAYRVNGGGVKAENEYATALYSGERGNAVKIKIRQNVDDTTLYDVVTYMDTTEVDTQTVSSAAELTANEFVSFKEDAELKETAPLTLAGGTNAESTGQAYQDYLDRIESYSFNTMGAAVTDETTKELFAAFNRRVRDEIGKKFQLVLYHYPEADYMGVISVKNKCIDGAVKGSSGMVYPDEAAAVYWTTGVQGGCAVNASCQNRRYDGEYIIDTDYTQNQLKKAVSSGEFVFHSVNGEVRVLNDINTMVTTTDSQGEIFKENQTIRVIDQLANEDSILFARKYLGVIPNNAAGRSALWYDLVKIRQELQRIQAIENFKETDVVVTPGDTKKAVVVDNTVTVVNAMAQLYMTTTIA